MDSVDVRQQQEASALAIAGETRGTPLAFALVGGLIDLAEDPWVQESAKLQRAKNCVIAHQFDEGISICNSLLDEPAGERGTSWRGRILKVLAVLTMCRPEFSPAGQPSVDDWLAEAEQIFKDERDPYQLGQVYQLQGVLMIAKGEQGTQRIEEGKRMELAFTKRIAVGEAGHHGPAGWSQQ